MSPPRLEPTEGNGTCDSRGSGNLHVASQRGKCLYRTSTLMNAGWSLNDYAWDKQANRVTYRAEIKEIGEARRGRGKQTAPIGLEPGSSDALVNTKFQAPMKTLKAKGKRTSKGKEKEPKAESDPVPFSRGCAVTGCHEMCHPSSKRRVNRMFCVYHGSCRDVTVDGIPQRYCQVCYTLHPLDAFKNTNRTCNAVLARKRMLRIQRQKRFGREGEGLEVGEASDLIDNEVGCPDKGTDALVDDSQGEGLKPKDMQTQDAPTRGRDKKGLVKGKPKPVGRKTTGSNPSNPKSHPDHGIFVGPYQVAPPNAYHSGWFGMSSNLFGLSSGMSHPNPKRARFGPAQARRAQNKMLLDMEHGVLGSYNISSSAIKVSHALPAFLSTAAGGTGGRGPAANQRLPANNVRGALTWKKDGSPPAAPLASKLNPNLSNCMDHEIHSLMQWMDNMPPDASRGRREEFGVDPFNTFAISFGFPAFPANPIFSRPG